MIDTILHFLKTVHLQLTLLQSLIWMLNDDVDENLFSFICIKIGVEFLIKQKYKSKILDDSHIIEIGRVIKFKN